MLKTIYMFRHGETDWNREGRMQGSTDIPLNEIGREQARQLREFFLSNPVDIFLSSDLSRAQETAQIVAANSDIGIVVDARLRETNLGVAEGLSTQEFTALYGEEILDRWRKVDAANQHVRLPNGESKQEHRIRFQQGLEELLHSAEAARWRRIGVATHGGSMRRLIHHLRPELTEAVMVGNCGTYKLEYQVSSRSWSIDINQVFVSK
jgi:broad specificity phosphatase PhoE